VSRAKSSSRRLWILVMMTAVGGCINWRPYQLGPGSTAATPLPYLLRATGQDSSRIVLTRPFVQADTLYGFIRRYTISLPVSGVVRLERERLNLGRTLALAIGVPALALGVIYLVACVDHDCTPGF